MKMKLLGLMAFITLGLTGLAMNINSLTTGTAFADPYYQNHQEPFISESLTSVSLNFKSTPATKATSSTVSEPNQVSVPTPATSSFPDWFSNMSASLVGGLIGTFVGFGLGIASDRRAQKRNSTQKELKALVLLKQEIANNRKKARSVLNANDALLDFQFFNSAWSAARFFSELEPTLYLVLDEVYQRIERISIVQGKFLDPSLWEISNAERKKITDAMQNFILGEAKNLDDSFNDALRLVEEREKTLKEYMGHTLF
jgi:hypothetical protein